MIDLVVLRVGLTTRSFSWQKSSVMMEQGCLGKSQQGSHFDDLASLMDLIKDIINKNIWFFINLRTFKLNHQIQLLHYIIKLLSMPELPEVETVRRFLAEVLLKPKAKKIKHVFTYYPSIIKEPEPAEFCKFLVGQSFSEIGRYGKFLILKLQKFSIISHLRMEGKYHYYEARPTIGKHDHIQFVMTDGSALVYSDVRKFGTMHLVPKGKEMDHKSLSKLGPQANEQDFTTLYLEEVCKTRTSSIKQVLLDQESVCGIGNIYADEILFSSGIHPLTSAKSLPTSKLEDIVQSSKSILDRAILNKGTTFKSFSSNHESGSYQNCLQVYDREGEECLKCHHKIQKTKVGGRGTHFCPKCQLKTH